MDLSEFNLYQPYEVELYPLYVVQNLEEKYIAHINELEFIRLRVKIKEFYSKPNGEKHNPATLFSRDTLHLSPYYLLYKGQRGYINKDGRLFPETKLGQNELPFSRIDDLFKLV